MFDVLGLIYICANLHSHKTKLKSTNLVVNFIYATNAFLDALASLGSMLESHSLINVFEILSNLGHIFRVCSEYVQGMFRVCSKYVQSMFSLHS